MLRKKKILLILSIAFTISFSLLYSAQLQGIKNHVNTDHINIAIDNVKINSSLNINRGMSLTPSAATVFINYKNDRNINKFKHISNKSYKILLYKSEETKAVLNNFRIFHQCPAQNCKATFNKKYASEADAILFDVNEMKAPPTDIKRTSSDQIWVWFTGNSPRHTLLNNQNISLYNDYFNWSMNYRYDADVHMPFGEVSQLRKSKSRNVSSYQSKKTKAGVTFISKCHTYHEEQQDLLKYIKEFMRVDTLYNCDDTACTESCYSNFEILQNYYFFIPMTDGECFQHITDEIWNSLRYTAVPIITTLPNSQCKQILPPNSYIHLDDYPLMIDLISHLIYLISHETEYKKYQTWRDDFKIINIHNFRNLSYFHYCRLCEKLNQPRNRNSIKIYNNLEHYFSIKTNCYNMSLPKLNGLF